MNKDSSSLGQQDYLTKESLSQSEYVEHLIHLLTSAASLVCATDASEKAAKLAYQFAEHALNQANHNIKLALSVFQDTQQLVQQMLIQKNQNGYKELFLKHPELNPSFKAFQNLLQEAEYVLSHPKWKHNLLQEWADTRRRSRELFPSDNHLNQMDGSHDSNEHHLNKRNVFHHKQVEKLLLEEQVGGACMTQQRRSPLRSPFTRVEALSSPLSELKTVSPPSRRSSSFTNMIVHPAKSSDRQ